LLRVTERITHWFGNNKLTLALFLDVERAFDKVRVAGLIYKVITAAFPAQIIQLVHSYLNKKDRLKQFTGILSPANGLSWQGFHRVAY